MTRKMKILFLSMGIEGHLSSCLGIANAMENRGHEIVFLTDRKQGELVRKKNYPFFCLEDEDENKSDETMMAEILEKMAFTAEDEARRPSIERFGFIELMRMFYDNIERFNTNVGHALAKIKPNLIVFDYAVFIPVLDECQIPYVCLYSAAPHFLYDDEKVPPMSSGYPSGDKTLWAAYREKFRQETGEILRKYSDYLVQHGYKPPGGVFELFSPYMSIYSYPCCLDFNDVAEINNHGLGEVFRLDGFQRDPARIPPSPIPQDFIGKSGKLVYFSLGSFFSCNVRLMNDIIDILSKSPHRFIVSKGMFGDRVKLGENMWGENYVNQLQILEIADAAIIHGGNNTAVECFYYGVPMIVIPTLGDQLDNAQRIAELGFGIRIDVNQLGERILLESLEKILNDETIKDRINQVSNEMKQSKRLEQLIDKLENLVESGKIYNAKEGKWINRE